MIKRIKLSKFKTIEDIELNLERVNILIGGNNSGKTSILQGIQFGVSIAQTVDLAKNINWKRDEIVRSIEPTELVYSPLREVSALAKGGELKQGKKYDIEILYEKDDGEKTSITVKRGKNRNIVAEIKGKKLGKQLQSMEEPFSIYVPGLAGIPYFEEFKTESIVRKAAARGDANNVLRNILWLLKQDLEGWESFNEELHELFPHIDVHVDFNPKNDEHIEASIVERKVIIKNGTRESVEQRLPIDAAGTGVLQAIQILSYVNVYNPKILVLDEPDAHLHPNNQRKIIKMVVNLAEKKDFQVILSTHSRHIIDELSNQANICWVREGDIIKEDEFDIVNIFMDLGALDKGDLLKNGKIKCVVLTEDSTDINMMEVLLESSGFEMDEVDIWSYNGCTKVDSAILLGAFIKKHAPSTVIVVHRDRDYLLDEEIKEYIHNIESLGLECFITKGSDVESYYLNTKHINFIYSTISTKRCEELIDISTDEKEEKTIKKFINSRTKIELANARKSGKGEVDNGNIALQCMKLYKGDKTYYRHGKLVLKSLKNNLQKEIGENINLIKTSQYISDETLINISKKIW